MRAIALACLLFAATGCAVAPNGINDPMGVGAALDRCSNTKPEDRTLPDWFAMFGPALACR